MSFARSPLTAAAAFVAVVALASPGCAGTGGAEGDPCRHRLAIAEDEGQVVYCADHRLGERGREVARLVVVVHGDARNADEYHDAVAGAARAADAEDTLVVAPRFPTARDLEEGDGADGHGGDDLLFWSSDAWKQGDTSRERDGAAEVSSFEAVDRIVETAVHLHPEVREIVVAGHSAGGQFVNRYAAGTPLPDMLAADGVAIRFVVANPSSYLYLDERRPGEGSNDAFERPDEEDRDDCPDYDEYKYGLRDLNEYLEGQGRPEDLRERYLSRRATYLLGAEDDDDEAELLDRTCAARLQGDDRLERGRAFHAYLGVVGGPDAHARHELVVVPDVGHDFREMFVSEEGRRALFADR